jgi:hypothetical protein
MTNKLIRIIHPTLPHQHSTVLDASCSQAKAKGDKIVRPSSKCKVKDIQSKVVLVISTYTPRINHHYWNLQGVWGQIQMEKKDQQDLGAFLSVGGRKSACGSGVWKVKNKGGIYVTPKTPRTTRYPLWNWCFICC